jgi:hypothetical protein
VLVVFVIVLVAVSSFAVSSFTAVFMAVFVVVLVAVSSFAVSSFTAVFMAVFVVVLATAAVLAAVPGLYPSWSSASSTKSRLHQCGWCCSCQRSS